MGAGTEHRVLTAIAACASALSCGVVLLFSRLVRSGGGGVVRGSRPQSFNVQLLSYLALSELLSSVAYLFYGVDEDSVNPEDGAVTALCQVQATLLQAGRMSSFLWVLVLVFNSYLTSFQLEQHPKKFELLYMALAWASPFVHAIVLGPLVLDYYGPTDTWCWIETSQHQAAQIANFYLPLMIIFGLALLLHLVIVRALRARVTRSRFGRMVSELTLSGLGSASVGGSIGSIPVPIMSGGVSTQDLHALPSGGRAPAVSVAFERSIAHMTDIWRTYLVLFFLFRAPSVIHRAWEWQKPFPSNGEPLDQIYALELLHAIASPLQGVLVLVLFLGNPRMKSLLAQKWRRATQGPKAIVSGRAITIQRNPGGAGGPSASSSSSAGTGGGYRSLEEDDSTSSMPGVQTVLPAAVWSHLEARATGPQDTRDIVPPTGFRAFPVHPAQQPLAISSTGAAGGVSSLRIAAGTWNMANEMPPLDLTHPAFETATVLPTDASHVLNAWLPSGNAADQFDVIAVGVQECEYDPLMGRGRRTRAMCSWRDPDQHVPSTEAHWFELVQTVVNRGRDQSHAPSRAGDQDHRPFIIAAALSMGHIRLIILVHPRHANILTDVRSSVEAAGLGNLYQNKGGVGVSFRLGLRQLAFINCHLAALDGFKEDRNEDVVQILARLQLQGDQAPGSSSHGGDLAFAPSHTRSGARASLFQADDCTCALEQDPTLAFDLCCFLGDLNYRFEVPCSSPALLVGTSKSAKKARQRDANAQILRAIAENQFEFMRDCDELGQLMKEKRLFVGWHEAALNFKPTYKYALPKRAKLRPRQVLHGLMASSVATTAASSSSSPSLVDASVMSVTPSSPPPHEEYDAKRTPAWCDRILYTHSSSASVKVLEYRDVPDIASSDHKPVAATLDIDFVPTRQAEARHQQKAPSSPERSDASSSASPVAVVVSPSPTRRRKKTFSDVDGSSSSATAGLTIATTGDGAAAFLEANPGALEVLSPASLRLLSGSVSASLASASIVPEPKNFYRIRFSQLALYDALDLYGAPLAQPYISFLGDVLCARADCGLGSDDTPGACIRSHTSIATPLTSSGDAMLHAARMAASSRPLTRGTSDAFSQFQSSGAALAANCIRCAEWDAGTDASEGVPSRAQTYEIPTLHTSRRLTLATIQASRLQLLVKDALCVGEVDALGIACVELAAGLASGGPQAEPVFFISPVLAQTKYQGFICGTFKVEPI